MTDKVLKILFLDKESLIILLINDIKKIRNWISLDIQHKNLSKSEWQLQFEEGD